MASMNRTDYELTISCPAFPEAYDVYLDGNQVGYIYARWGRLTAYYLVDGDWETQKEIYHSVINGFGEFEEDERNYFINRSIAAIDDTHHSEKKVFDSSHHLEDPIGWVIK